MQSPTVGDWEALIGAALRDLNAAWGHSLFASPAAATPVYGMNSPLDSLALVTLIAEIEARAAEQWGIEIVLADERAMSRHRSPFRDVGTLAAFAAELAAEGAA